MAPKEPFLCLRSKSKVQGSPSTLPVRYQGIKVLPGPACQQGEGKKEGEYVECRMKHEIWRSWELKRKDLLSAKFGDKYRNAGCSVAGSSKAGGSNAAGSYAGGSYAGGS